MSPPVIALLAVSILLVLLMLLDRLLQAVGRPPGRLFDFLQLLTAISGVILHGFLFYGSAWAIRFLLVILIVPVLIETVALKSGFPFGRYRYLSGAGPRLPGGVPAAVAMMWWGLLYVAFNTATAVTMLFGIQYSTFAVIFITAIAVTAWDLTGDPVAVHAGMWEWEDRGLWHGIPATNFSGWLLVAGVTILIALIIAGRFPIPANSNAPEWIFLIPALLFGMLLLNYAGAARRRGLTGAAWSGLINGVLVLAVYIMSVI